MDIEPHIIKPDIQIKKLGRNSVNLTYNGNDNIDFAIEAINKKLERSGFPKLSENHLLELKEKATLKKSEPPQLSYSWNIDFAKLKLAYMKIAYEFGFYLWGYGYINDSVAQEIRERLYKYIYDDIFPDDLDNYAKWGTFDVSQLLDSILGGNYKESNYVHVLISSGSNIGLTLAIMLFDKMHCAVRYCSGDARFSQIRMFVAKYPSCEMFEV